MLSTTREECEEHPPQVPQCRQRRHHADVRSIVERYGKKARESTLRGTQREVPPREPQEEAPPREPQQEAPLEVPR